MKTLRYWLRALIRSALLAFTIWLFSAVWSRSSLASDNIMNAVEASVKDTVPQSTWLEISFGTFALFATSSALVSAIPLRAFSVFSWWEKPLVFGAPIAFAAISPLVGAPAPLLSFAVIAVCLKLRLEKVDKSKIRQLPRGA